MTDAKKLTVTGSGAAASAGLADDIRRLVRESRTRVATAVNEELTLLYWRIGKRINDEVLKGGRAGYGEEIVHAVSAQLRNMARGSPSATSST